MYQQVKLGDKFKLYRGSSPRPIINYISNNNSDPYWIKIGDMPDNGYIVNSIKEHISIEGAKKSRRVYKGDMILSNSMSFGKPYILNVDGFIHDGWFVIRNYERSFDRDYLRYLLASPTVQKRYSQIAAGGVVLNISSDLVNSVIVKIPSLDEQKKISSFLSVLDERIQVQNKIIEDLNKLKKSLIDDKFTNTEFSISLKEVLIERKSYSEKGLEYEHVTLSKDGIIPKGERYDRDFLVTNESKEYKITKLNDICYNPANLKFGVICLNDYKDSIFSPIYVTFEVSKKYDPYYVSIYLTSDKFIKKILKYQQGTVYERMSVNPDDFLKGRLPIIKDQESFINLIKTIERKCIVEKELLKNYEIQKEYLLKNMFI